MSEKNETDSLQTGEIRIDISQADKIIIDAGYINNYFREVRERRFDDVTRQNIEEFRDIEIATGDFLNSLETIELPDNQAHQAQSQLIYEYQKFSFKIAAFETDEKIKLLDKKTKEIEAKHKKIEEGNNSLVYTILSFIASFSVITASVEAVKTMQGSEVYLFLSFILFILITTLVVLDNFYKRQPSKNNHLLWLVALLFLLVMILVNQQDGTVLISI